MTARVAQQSRKLRRLKREHVTRPAMRELADQAFSRAAGAQLVEGNQVKLLKDAAQNYPAWLEAIANAKRYVHFESYIIHEDDVGWTFADALTSKARDGVHVHLLYDWMGGFGKTSRSFWNHMRAGGVEVRCYNPPQWDSPLGWLSRDHRKTLTVDGEIAFITGLCVGRMWVGVPEQNIEPWRDTGVGIRGPAVAEIEKAFANVWATCGPALPDDEIAKTHDSAPEGDKALRVVATVPATAGMMRLDQLVMSMARHRVWLTDAYYAGTTLYMQALRAAAKDGVDVRLLVPNATDIPILRPLSRSGYRPLLEAGVRVFEWNGTMLHAKTAVVDGRWARVGSTNLNLASWLGNCELDAVVEDEPFARQMEDMYQDDLRNSTEVVLDERHKVRAPSEPRHKSPIMTSGGGSSGRAMAGALRIGNAVGAAFTSKRILEPVEARLMLTIGVLLFVLAIIFVIFPSVLIYPAVALCIWFATALLYRGYKLQVSKSTSQGEIQPTETSPEAEIKAPRT